MRNVVAMWFAAIEFSTWYLRHTIVLDEAHADDWIRTNLPNSPDPAHSRTTKAPCWVILNKQRVVGICRDGPFEFITFEKPPRARD